MHLHRLLPGYSSIVCCHYQLLHPSHSSPIPYYQYPTPTCVTLASTPHPGNAFEGTLQLSASGTPRPFSSDGLWRDFDPENGKDPLSSVGLSDEQCTMILDNLINGESSIVAGQLEPLASTEARQLIVSHDGAPLPARGQQAQQTSSQRHK